MLTWLEINSKNLNHNVDQYHKLSPDLPIWPVIKSNAYGHGLAEVAKILDANKHVFGFMVVSLSEAIELKRLTKKPIMVLSYFDRSEEELVQASAEQIALPIYDLDTAHYLNTLGKSFLVSIKIDTGTSRLGFRAEEAVKAIKHIETLENLKIDSLYTHYAESENDDQTFTTEQLDVFKSVCQHFPKYKNHTACSAAALSQHNRHGDIIRLGISLYGLWPSVAAQERGLKLGLKLKPVLSWKTKIVQVKRLKAGQSIGYNRTYVTDKDCDIAILPIGYNEGYDRSLSNKAEVVVNKQRCPIRGNICMNLTMIELPAKHQAMMGTEVEIIGPEIKVEELAEHARTINYEVITRINSYIKRIVV